MSASSGNWPPSLPTVLLALFMLAAVMIVGAPAFAGRSDDGTGAIDQAAALSRPQADTASAGTASVDTASVGAAPVAAAQVDDQSTTAALAIPEPPAPAPLESQPPSPPTPELPTPDTEHAVRLASLLSPLISLPSDCPLPLGDPESLPNADRSYRSGTHQGIDFICGETGRAAVAAMPGRAVIVSSGYREPEPNDRQAVLEIAGRLDRTPPWTLTMLYGNHVVVDHGIVPDVGHVVSLYAHLESVASTLTTGQVVEAGQALGIIGNTGTRSAATGTYRAQSLHLHWEIYVDDRYLGAGLSAEDTETVYRQLFESASALAIGAGS